jgi:CRP-like cAMP-binding protein
MAMNNLFTTNRLIAALPLKDRQHFLKGCESVDLTASEVLYLPGQRIKHVYFPTSSFVSMVREIDDRSTLEMGLIGREGMVGSPLILGVRAASLNAVVQGAGSALQMSAATFLLELEHSLALRKRLQKYTYVLMSQLSLMAACTRFHLVEERLARLLLITQDRSHSGEFRATHEFLANMMGVRRVGITKAATSLQNSNLISYSRGNVTILDRLGLEVVSCECYEADKTTYSTMMG